MNLVSVTGGKAFEREITEKVVNWCIKKMMPRMRTLDIEVKLRNLDAYGYCLKGDDNRTYELEIRKGMRLYDLVSTICHEMIHVKQYAKNEIRFNERTGVTMWKKSRVSEKTTYENLPWEKEAFRNERELALECFEACV